MFRVFDVNFLVIRKQLTLFLIFISIGVFAQLKQADNFYDGFDYRSAIPLYEKAIKRYPKNIIALSRLADCYRITKNYPLAELTYARVIAIDSIDPTYRYNYAQVLKINGKTKEASKQMRQYAQLVPGDKRAFLQLRSMDELSIFSNLSAQYEVKSLIGINTARSEFAPVSYNKGIVFTADRLVDLVNVEDSKLHDVSGLTILYAQEKSESFSKPKSVSEKINANGQNGPATFSSDGKMVCFNRVEDVGNADKQFVSRLKLFFSVKENDKWLKPTPFKYNSDKYSLLHPSFSADGKYLFFASDMPGGFGGNDIYFSTLVAGEWSAPENLGASVNTPGDEVFPYLRSDSTLFFSSDTHTGYGGLDVFSCVKINNNWTNVVNLGQPINSSMDDFSVTFSLDGNKGYFASNRAGGLGDDDIYAFNVLSKFITLSGKIYLNKDKKEPARYCRLFLMVADTITLREGFTDSLGVFKFDNLDPKLIYHVKVDETNPLFKTRDKYFLANSKDEIVKITVVNKSGEKFIFQNLPSDLNSLKKLDLVDQDLNLAGFLVTGDKVTQPAPGIKLKLLNSKGESLMDVVTDDLGGFVFHQVPKGIGYSIVPDDSIALKRNTTYSILDKTGRKVITANTNANGKFRFAFVASDEVKLPMLYVEDTELKLSFRGRVLRTLAGEPIRKVMVYMLNTKGDTLERIATDTLGYFEFSSLPLDQNYLFSVNENDPALNGVDEAIILNKQGKPFSRFQRGKKYTFSLLMSDKNTLSDFVLADPGFNFVLKGKLVTGDQNKPLSRFKLNLINSNGDVRQSAQTDEKGFFRFTTLTADEHVVFDLDQTDPRLASLDYVKVLTEKGLLVQRVNVAKGKLTHFSLLPSELSSLLSVDVNDAPLHLNYEGLLLTADEKRSPISGVKLNLVDINGNAVRENVTNEKGLFSFKNLPSDVNFLVKVDEDDPQLAGVSKVILADTKGKVIREIKLVTAQRFSFAILPSDLNYIASINYDDVLMDFAIKGKLVNTESGKPICGVKVKMASAGSESKETKTDSLGVFMFTHLSSDRLTFFEIDANDPALNGLTRVSVLDERGKFVREISVNGRGKMSFALLYADRNALLNLDEVDDTKLKVDILGSVKSLDDDRLLSGVEVFLINSSGKIEQRIKTNSKGKFLFSSLNPDENYLLSLNESDPQLKKYSKVAIVNSKGALVSVFSNAADQKKHDLSVLPSDMSTLMNIAQEDAALSINLTGRLLGGSTKQIIPLVGKKLRLVNGEGALVQEVVTDGSGEFKFMKLPSDIRYSMVLDTLDPVYASMEKVIVQSKAGKVVKVFTHMKKAADFKYELLASDLSSLANITAEDVVLQSLKLHKQMVKDSITVVENIYYDLGSFMLLPDAQRVLNKVAEILNVNKKLNIVLSAHTDSRASSAYNLELSRKRANEAARYLIAKGRINAKRVSQRGYGESMLLNKCSDGVECSEQQHAQNRRMEFKFIRVK